MNELYRDMIRKGLVSTRVIQTVTRQGLVKLLFESKPDDHDWLYWLEYGNCQRN